jgi:gluconolactonase
MVVKNYSLSASFSVMFFFVMVFSCNSPSAPIAAWQQKNDSLIKVHQLVERKIEELPHIDIPSIAAAGEVMNAGNLDSVLLHPGVQARIFTGKGAMVSVLELKSEAVIPEEQLPADRFLFVIEGEIKLAVNGATVNMLALKRENPDGTHSGTPRTDFIYIQKGSKSSLTAGSSGARLLEVYSPVRLDYLRKAGVKNLPDDVADLATLLEPNVEPNKVYDLYDFQFTPLAPGAHTRLISGRNVQFSFATTDPDSAFRHHIHPEEQMMYVLRGEVEQIILDREEKMKAGDMMRIAGNMVHGSRVGELGADALDIFWPVRTDYREKEMAALSAYHKIIPEKTKPELIVDGKKTKPELFFTEGPKWLNGKLYFSNMFFDQQFNADPKKSSIVEMDPDGNYRNITEGKMQANGLYPYKNGNLLVCDMMGHRVVEMTTNGEVVKVIADSYDGKKIDGPNDVIADAKGGVYFTDPQFTMEAKKFQPGRAVYYVSPAGDVKRLVEPNEFAMPNGIVLSPDGKTLFINNCYDDESWYPVKSDKDNFVWAYDVAEDGTISNGRKFAKLFLTGEVLDRKGRSSSADGMAIDKSGNLYVCTYSGVQIFNAKGDYVGMINLPSFPVSLCFGGDDMKTLYIVSYSKVYKIKTNMEGFIQRQ